MRLLARVKSEPQLGDRGAESAEITALITARRADVESPRFNERVGRAPVGSARGWQAREQKAKSCELCEGDLWVEAADGSQQPCQCRQRRADRRTRNQLRAGNWWHGTSLSFAAPPLAQINQGAADQIHRLCDDIGQGRPTNSLWLIGDHGHNKSAVCAYLGQRLFPNGKVAVEHLGDLMAHLRWLGAVKGEGAVEAKLEALVEVPLLVIDDLDRAIRTFPAGTPLAMRESLSSRDLIRLATLLDERISSMRPFVVTSRAEPRGCAEHTTAISKPDLLRGLLATAAGVADPFEDFPNYTLALVAKVIDQLQDACRPCQLSSTRSLGEVA
jgi:DNA replication protein DnaC